MIQSVVKSIIKAKKIVFFTGAGVSTESGIPDFRSSKGLYNEKYYGYNPETILSHDFFFSHPEIFFRFYHDNIIHANAKPNAFHYGITKLIRMNFDVTVVTQNIDNLHNMASNGIVLELHGSISNNHCTKCNKHFSLNYMLLNRNKTVRCDLCNSLVKPDIVLYEEELNEFLIEKSIKAISEADVMIVAGTSLSVYPAASFIDFYMRNCLCIINKSTTLHDSKADYVFHDSCSTVLSKIIEEMEKYHE